MMYKDGSKRREADRNRQRRRRDKIKAEGVTKQGVTEGVTPVTEQQLVKVAEQQFTEEVSKIFDVPERTAQGNIRVSKPGDADYVPQCETTRAFIEGRDKRPEAGKRGKEIKVFADLPPDVQQTIDRMSDDKVEHKRRTAIAVNYQHQFPGLYYTRGFSSDRSNRMGVITGKHGDAEHNGDIAIAIKLGSSNGQA